MHSERHRNAESEDSDVKSFLLLKRVFRVGTDWRRQCLDLEPDLRHAPLIINASGCNANRGAFGQENERSAWIRRHSSETCSAIFRWQTVSCIAMSKTRACWQDYCLRRQRFRGWSSLEKKSTTEVFAQMGNLTLKTGSTLQRLKSLSVGEAEFYAVVKRNQVGLSLRSIHIDMGIPMKVEIQSGCSTANSLTDRLGARLRTQTSKRDTSWLQERVQLWDFNFKRVLTGQKLCGCGNEASLCYSSSAALQICRIGILLTHACVLVTVSRHELLDSIFLIQNPLFSNMSGFSDPEWVYQLSRTEHFHSAESHRCSEPPQWLASSLPIQVK